jgi:hypothetical protein
MKTNKFTQKQITNASKNEKLNLTQDQINEAQSLHDFMEGIEYDKTDPQFKGKNARIGEIKTAWMCNPQRIALKKQGALLVTRMQTRNCSVEWTNDLVASLESMTRKICDASQNKVVEVIEAPNY